MEETPFSDYVMSVDVVQFVHQDQHTRLKCLKHDNRLM